jgi:glycosyltransferase involved in cell wall biosynthesis
MKKKVIASLGIKNEDWIIEKTLKVLDQFCDKIIIVDDHSTDNTESICRSFEKVEWYVNVEHDWKVRTDGVQKMIAIDAIKPHNPDYVLFLDADEIPFKNMPDFIDERDESIDLWKLPFVHLWGDENHYRVDKFKTSKGIEVNYNPFDGPAEFGLGGGSKKGFLMRWVDGHNYSYRTDHHILPMEPQNVPGPWGLSNETGILHYGKITEHFTSGKKDEEYAVMRSHTMGFNLQDRIKHHEECRDEMKLEVKEVNPEWLWEGIND